MCVPDCLLLVCALKNHFLQSSPSCMRLSTASLSPLMSCALKPNFRFLLCQATPPLNKVTKENGSHVVTWKFVEKKSSEAQITSKSNSEGEKKTCFFQGGARREETKSLVIEYQKKYVKPIRFIMHR